MGPLAVVAPYGVDSIGGTITSWSCPARVIPPAFPPAPGSEPTDCHFRGERALSFTHPTVTVGRNLSSARVLGTAVAHDRSGRKADVRVRVDLRLRAVAPTESYVFEGGSEPVSRITVSTRASVVTGHVGPIGIGDERSDITEGKIGLQQAVIVRP